MLKRLHLVGDVNENNIHLLIQSLEMNEKITKIEYIENSHDLHFETETTDYLETVDHIIEENNIHIKVIERKKGTDKTERPFEKKIFLFSDLKSQENAVFLVSYLLNDPQVREAKFDHNQKILTLETNDPFIYTKIKHVIDAFGENIEITENYTKEMGINYRLMYRYLYIALLLFSFALYIVTRKEPTVVTVFSGIVMYGLLSVPFVLTAIERIKEKDYLNFNNLILVGTFLLLLINRPLEASTTLFVFHWLKISIRSFSRQIVNHLVATVDHLVRYVEVVGEEENEEKQVEEVEVGDIVISKAGDILYFDGKVVEGNGKVDSLLMNGNQELTEVSVGSTITAGCEVNEGIIQVEVTKTYSATYFNKIYEWNPKHLIEKGYLEVRDNKENFYYTVAALVASLFIMIAGLITHNHYLLTVAFLMIIICYPFTCSLLGPYVYENAMIVALKNNILIKDENSLSKMIEWAKSKPSDQINHSVDLTTTGISCANGNYMDEATRQNNDCIYRDYTVLMEFFKYLKTYEKTWRITRYSSYVIKALGILFYSMHLISFVGMLILEAILSYIILLTVKALINKGVE